MWTRRYARAVALMDGAAGYRCLLKSSIPVGTVASGGLSEMISRVPRMTCSPTSAEAAS